MAACHTRNKRVADKQSCQTRTESCSLQTAYGSLTAMIRIPIVLALLASLAAGDDPYCPAYPKPQRQTYSARLAVERTAQAMSTNLVRPVLTWSGPRNVTPPGNNIIDDEIFRKMSVAGVEPAPLTSDVEILRRLSLDLTGRIPSEARVRSFVEDTGANKRARLIDELMSSEAFVDNWTSFFANHFEVTSQYYYFIGIPGRNLFYNYLRNFVEGDRSYSEVVTELIATSGDSLEQGPLNFLVRGVQEGDPVQDTWDVLADRITSKFLGVRTECVSCHDGANHLEEINLYLSERRREEFWGLSAFLARTNLIQLPVDAFEEQSHFIIADRPTGVYTGVVDLNNPGPRPFRTTVAKTPVYMFTGEEPGTANWRSELARMVVSDRQFARATVNYIWAHFFRAGIVDPPNGWDLARIDPDNPPPAPWALQPTHPELMEALTDEFIRSNYSIHRIIRLISESRAYQLSSNYPGEWKPEYELFFAKHVPRRMTPEEIYDAVITATKTETPMWVEGFDRPLYYAGQLPDPSEPRSNYQIMNFLDKLGRGDWWRTPGSQDSTVLHALFMMNDGQINDRAFANRGVLTQVTRVAQANLGDREAVDRLFLSTLGRWSTDEEFEILLSAKGGDYEQWLTDCQWALLNKLDFVFNY